MSISRWSGLHLSMTVLLLLLLASCIPDVAEEGLQGTTTETPEGGDTMNVYYIASNCELSTYDDNLRIGAGNFGEREYTDDQGETGQGLTAGLALYVADGSAPSQDIQVYTGQEVVFSRYRIRVVEIGQSNEGTCFVRIAIGEVGEPGEGMPGD